jgi:signal transduction histidine kinase/CheY-like chemotaxis protein
VAYPKQNIFNYLLLVGLIATAYVIFGMLGLYLAVPPSNAGSVWPPAGIALASILLFGKRIWPGIFIGNFLVSAWAFEFNNELFLIFLATGFGATLCALTGSFLIHRYVGFPNALINEKAIMLFFLLGGPLSCLIPATIGLTTMLASGIISFSEITNNWFSWWAGDTLGVLVFTPLMLILFCKNHRLWKQRRLSVGLPLVISLILLIVFFLYVTKLENNQQRNEYNNLSKNLTQALGNRINSHLYAISIVNNFILGSKKVVENEFALIAYHPSSQFKELKSVQWFVPAGRQHPIVTKFKLLYNEKYNIKPEEKIYFRTTKQQISQSYTSQIDNLNSGQVTASYERYHNTLHYRLPVYKKTWENSDFQQLLGILSLSIDISMLVKESFRGMTPKRLLLSINMLNSEGQPSVIFSEHKVISKLPDFTTYQHKFTTINQQQWLMDFHPDLANFSSEYHWPIWWVLISGLLFNSLLGISLLILTGRNFRTEAIVKSRTAELSKENNNRKLVEKELHRAKDKAESASRAKNQFLSNISHELRTPLNGILGFTQLILKSKSMDGEDKKKVNIIKSCGEYLLTLINDILDISVIEAQKLELVPSTFDFKCFLFDIFAVFQLRATEEHLFFKIQTKSLPTNVLGDEKRIRQILINILSNAFKFTNRGGITISVSYTDEEARFIIQDTGCGIPEQHLQNIFNPFIQIDNTQHVQEGTGLGLAITDKLVQLMKGKITVNSVINQGTVFSVIIPLPKTIPLPTPSVKNKKISGYEGPRQSILIVDDNENNIQIFKIILEKLDFQVSTVSSGSECLTFCSNALPDLILMDMMMPVMNGMETTRKVIKLYPLMSNRIIGMSASVFTDEKNNFLDSGCANFIAKPMNQATLLSCIADTIDIKWRYKYSTKKVAEAPFTVLLADDNEINRLLLKNMLENLQCNVEIACNGKEAKQLVLNRHYQMAFIDLNMPIINGFELITAIRNETGSNQNIPCAAISAYADSEKTNAALEAGFNNFVIKPINENELQNLVMTYRQK